MSLRKRPLLDTDSLVALITFCFIAGALLGILGWAFIYAGR